MTWVINSAKSHEDILSNQYFPHTKILFLNVHFLWQLCCRLSDILKIGRLVCVYTEVNGGMRG